MLSRDCLKQHRCDHKSAALSNTKAAIKAAVASRTPRSGSLTMKACMLSDLAQLPLPSFAGSSCGPVDMCCVV
jgi:hypothetical protein